MPTKLSAYESVFLVADIGGTHVRFSIVHMRDETLTIEVATVFQTKQYASLEAALDGFLADKLTSPLDVIAVCAAGPLQGSGAEAYIHMTNYSWNIAVGNLARFARLPPILMNDFAALAWAIAELGTADIVQVGGGVPLMDEPVVILGPGTGLGTSALFRKGNNLFPISGEGGHTDLAPTNSRELAILTELMRSFDHVSAEHVLSGPGLVTLHAAINTLDGKSLGSAATPEKIVKYARDRSAPDYIETIEIFCAWLGSFAGNLALTFGAKGGVYIAGGIVPDWLRAARPGLFDEKLFRNHFEAKGRLQPYLQSIPTYIVTRGDPALLGLARAAKDAIFLGKR